MTEAAMPEAPALTDLLAQTLGRAPAEIGQAPWDSLGQLLVALVIEERYGLRLSTMEIAALSSLEAVEDLLRERGEIA